MNEIVLYLLNKLESINSFSLLEELPSKEYKRLRLIKYGNIEYEIEFRPLLDKFVVECSKVKTIPILGTKIKTDKRHICYETNIAESEE